MKVLAFDLWGPYAHFKKIYATTTALSYAIPPKTALYGFAGAVLGLPKAENAYLEYFQPGACVVGIQLINPIKTQRIGVNLRPNRGRWKINPKPTLMEFISEPKYRIWLHHKDADLQLQLKTALQSHTAVFIPSLGLANLMADFAWIGEYETEKRTSSEAVAIHSVLPRQQFIRFGEMNDSDIIEQSMFSMEMDTDRSVTGRDDILIDRKGKAIYAVVTHYYPILDYGSIALF